MMEDTIRLVLQGVTLIVASLGFLAVITNWFKRTIPIQFGFLRDEKIIDLLNIATGDPAKQLFLRFHNSEKLTLTGLVLDIRFHRPIALSGTEQALKLYSW